MLLNKNHILTLVFLLASYSGFCLQDEAQLWSALKSKDSGKVIAYLKKNSNLASQMEILSTSFGADSVMILFEEAFEEYIIDESSTQAEKIAKEVIVFAKEKDNSIFIATSFLILGNVFRHQGRTDEALALYIDAMEAIKSKPDSKLKLKIQNSLGLIHLDAREYGKAIEYFIGLIGYAKALADYTFEARAYLNLAYPYMSKNSLDTAEIYITKALETSKKINDPIIEAYAIGNLATIYLMRNDYQKAILYQSKGLEIEQKLNDRLGMIDSHGVLSSCHVALGDPIKATYHFNKAQELANAIGDINKIMEVYKEGQFIFADLGNYKMSFEYAQKYHQLYDSLFNVEKNKQFGELREKYETAQKEAKILTLEEQKLMQELKIRQQRDQNILLLVAAALLLAIAFFIFALFVQIRKRKQEVETRNETITKINKALNKSQDELLNSNKTKDKFFALIAHDLRGPVTSLQGIGRMLEYYNKKGDENRINQLISQVDQSASSVNHLLDNLLKWALSQTDGLNYQPATIQLTGLIEEIKIIFDEGLKAKQIELKVNQEGDFSVVADYNMISTVLRNLLSNAIKFSQPDSEVAINVFQSDNQVTIEVSDSGVGMSPETIKRILSDETVSSTRGTLDEKGTGLGLVLCRDFVLKHGSELHFVSDQNGTSISFKLSLVGQLESA